MVNWDILTGHRLSFQKNIAILSLKIDFVSTNMADPDEMPHHAICQCACTRRVLHQVECLGVLGTQL